MSTLYPLQKLLIVPYLQISNNNEKVGCMLKFNDKFGTKLSN